MIPIDQTTFLQHPARRHSTIPQYSPHPQPQPQIPSSSVSPPLTFGAVSSSPSTNDPTDLTCEENKRSAHNALERQRREGLNSKFQQLAHALPGLQNIRRPSKSMVVGKSLEFVTRSVQRDSYYKNKIRQLRKEHDTLRKHTQRSQQYLKKKMNETAAAEEESKQQQQQKAMMMRTKSDSIPVIPGSRRTSSSSSSGGVAVAAATATATATAFDSSGGKQKSSPDQQHSPDAPAIKRHKSRSSSSLVGSTKKATTDTTTTTTVLHKFVHHHASSSNTHEKPAPMPTNRRPVPKDIRTSPPTATTKTENIDPAMVVMAPQQQSRHTSPPTTTTSLVAPPPPPPPLQQQLLPTPMFPFQVSWPPLDVSALQPPEVDEGLAFYSPVDLYTSVGISNNNTMAIPTTTTLWPYLQQQHQ